MRFGLPHVILSDNGREFDNELDKTISDLLGICDKLSRSSSRVSLTSLTTQSASDRYAG